MKLMCANNILMKYWEGICGSIAGLTVVMKHIAPFTDVLLQIGILQIQCVPF